MNRKKKMRGIRRFEAETKLTEDPAPHLWTIDEMHATMSEFYKYEFPRLSKIYRDTKRWLKKKRAKK